ncbi:hypothetical protein SDC9_56632 [bioreactor metagenome]|uniref:Pepco domain-containing protein n=1 Tax=bioreactor metagenome TaxID=1076179 RepID=A0A644X839_9ZZZZ
MSENSITIITMSDTTDTKGGLPIRPSFPKQIEISSDELADRMLTFVSNFQRIYDVKPEATDGFYIDEIELSLVINASGGIELIGKATAGMEGGIKVKLKRRKGKD